MPVALSFDTPVTVSIGFYKPQPLFTTDCVLQHLCKIFKCFENTGCAKFAILKSVNDSPCEWVAVYTVWETGSHAVSAYCQLPSVDAFHKAVCVVAQVVEHKWYEVSCGQRKEDTPCKSELFKGDVVNMRGIFVEPDRQELLSYSCLALLKAYFHKTAGLQSYNFYKSLDGTKIAGLGIWDSVEAACMYKRLAPGLPYWKRLGVKKLRYGVCEAVYVSGCERLETASTMDGLG